MSYPAVLDVNIRASGFLVKRVGERCYLQRVTTKLMLKCYKIHFHNVLNMRILTDKNKNRKNIFIKKDCTIKKVDYLCQVIYV